MSPNPFLSFLLLLPVSLAHSLVYPIQSQLPLVAQVGIPYSWPISPSTFAAGSPIPTATKKPPWISFANYTFSGTPSVDDLGTANVEITAGYASDDFTIYVTSAPPPTISNPLLSQFKSSNPSFSSVFFLHNNSALASNVPTVRVPPNWSFSIGLDGYMFKPGSSNQSLYYAALAGDGTPLPSWLQFNSEEFTFNGVTYSPPIYDPDWLSVSLIASEYEGYSSISTQFNIVVAQHELWFEGSQAVVPLNFSSGNPFNFSLGAQDWVFQAMKLNDKAVSRGDVTRLFIDTTSTPWLHFDSSQLTIAGSTPEANTGSFTLPATVSASNQTLNVNVTVNVVPSYFKESPSEPLGLETGATLTLSLAPYLSGDSWFDHHSVNLSASFLPSSWPPFLRIGKDLSNQWLLSGFVPENYNETLLNVSILALDFNTNATSLLGLSFSTSEAPPKGQTLTRLHNKKRVAVGIGIGLGIFGGLLVLCGFLALCRKWFAVKDTALDFGAEKAYASPGGGYGWSMRPVMGLGLHDDQIEDAVPVTKADYSSHFMNVSPPSATLNKGEFFAGLRSKVRDLSGSFTRTNKRRPVITNPILMITKDSEASLSYNPNVYPVNSTPEMGGSVRSMDLVEADGISLGIKSSSSVSTATTQSVKSLPRQRPDFGPPRGTLGLTPPLPAPPRPCLKKTASTQPSQTDPNAKRRSTDSERSHSSGDLEEAVITTASRAQSIHSVRSGRSSSAIGQPLTAKPRLVQFTGARDVPLPFSTPRPASNDSAVEVPRRVSHVAHVCGPGEEGADAILNDGLRFVCAFGNQGENFGTLEAVDAVEGASAAPASKYRNRRSVQVPSSVQSTSTHTSYMYPSPSVSYDSSQDVMDSMPRILIGTGESFVFKLPLNAGRERARRRASLVVRKLHGGVLPPFMSYSVAPSSPASGASHVSGPCNGDEVELWGTPGNGDAGDVMVGVFDGEQCVGKLVVEVVSRI